MKNGLKDLLNVHPDHIKKITDLNGDTFLVESKAGKWLDPQTYQNADGSISSTDPNMVTREFHNQHNEDVFFTKMYPHLVGAEKIGVKPDHFCVLPHAYYFISCKSGRDIKGKFLYGKDMFQQKRGNK